MNAYRKKPKFLHNAIIYNNDKALRDDLRKYGYKIIFADDKPYLITNVDKGIVTGVDNNYDVDFDSVVNCGNNKSLFLAIAALRSDTDRFQWFLDDIHGCVEMVINDNLPSRYMQLNGHKATVEELKEIFKDN